MPDLREIFQEAVNEGSFGYVLFRTETEYSYALTDPIQGKPPDHCRLEYFDERL